jgi:hypothetical protein
MKPALAVALLALPGIVPAQTALTGNASEVAYNAAVSSQFYLIDFDGLGRHSQGRVTAKPTGTRLHRSGGAHPVGRVQGAVTCRLSRRFS